MYKIVVFDSGWGGEMFADFLEQRIPAVEVVRLIDWRKAPYSALGKTDICTMVEEALMPFIGRVDVIVLASYAATVTALDYLKWKYPEQKFVGFEVNLSRYALARRNVQSVMVLATGVVEQSIEFQKDLFEMRHLKVWRPECREWIQMVDDGEMTIKKLREGLGEYTQEKVDMILIYSTGFVDLKPALEEIYGMGVAVDDFEEVLQKVCGKLNIVGTELMKVRRPEVMRRLMDASLIRGVKVDQG